MDEKKNNEFNNFSFKKIFGVIPVSVFDELKNRDKFNNNWDAWLSSAISEKLEREKKGEE